MPRHDEKAGRDPAMRHRNAGERGCGNSRTHSRNDLERDARGGKSKGLFPTPPQNEGIAALETCDTLSAQRCMDHDAMDNLLRCGLAAGTLADVEGPRPTSQSDHCRGHQRVVKHEIRLAQAARGLDREKLRIARPGSDQGNHSLHHSERSR